MTCLNQPMSQILAALAVPALLAISSATSMQASELVNEPRFYADDPLWTDPDQIDTPEMTEFDLRKDADFLINTFLRPKTPAGRALNVNTLDETPDSSWFTNRIGKHEMKVEDIVRGPGTVAGPATGRWVVTGRPPGGITPKFTIQDARGDTYILKLDPIHLPELPSSAEMISTKIFHALGYNVPENFIVRVDPGDLDISEDALWVDGEGHRRNITRRDLDNWLEARAQASSDRKVRALASRFIKGKPIGQFEYHGVRPDDPNDIYPHESRRELRALRVFAAWLNHDDSRSLNSFDTWVEKDGRRSVMHYLLDFGSNLGSGSTNVQEPRAGNEYRFEPDKIAKGVFSFGLWQRGWMNVKYPRYPAIGNFEADYFEPQRWRPEYPNPAFDRMDEADAFWGAKLMSRFTDEMIRAVVRTGQISDAEAEAYLITTLIKRRDKCVRYWISRTNPLDNFEVRGDGDELRFDNAATRIGAVAGVAEYSVQWSSLDNLRDIEDVGAEPIQNSEKRVQVPADTWGPRDDSGFRYAVARIRTLHSENPQWEEPVVVSLRQADGAYDVVGIRRPRRDPARFATKKCESNREGASGPRSPM